MDIETIGAASLSLTPSISGYFFGSPKTLWGGQYTGEAMMGFRPGTDGKNREYFILNYQNN
jgi:hypothetical protein